MASERFGVPDSSMFEDVACYYCGCTDDSPFLTAQDDLTGHAGDFTFVTCNRCGLRYQQPRLKQSEIHRYYGDEYIAHRKRANWGPLTPFYNYAMGKHDRDKLAIVERAAQLDATDRILDVGCGAGTFLQALHSRWGSQVSGVDFVDLSQHPGMDGVDFHHGLLREAKLDDASFDLITMWHFLEHDYDPIDTLAIAQRKLRPGGRLIIEVPSLDSWSFKLFRNRWPGLQAPQHTVLFDHKMLEAFAERAGLRIVEHLPWGAFPASLYLFMGLAFSLKRQRGLDLGRAIYPYFALQLALAPLLLFERQLNLAMQTIVCESPR